MPPLLRLHRRAFQDDPALDVAVSRAILNRVAAGDDADLRRHYALLTQQLVANRTALMAYRLFLPLRRGRVFVAVGALHLYGAKGLLAQLHEQCYRLNRIY